MRALASQNKKAKVEHGKRKVQTENNVEPEMRECLARLKAWQTENLMALQGMDKFTGENKNRKS